ncbi:MAG: hypothetical protein H6Q44_1926 [Deltaproteobacteria bacterium]|nr:hypothetical protein [Deltaproteobacteria bacterium]
MKVKERTGMLRRKNGCQKTSLRVFKTHFLLIFFRCVPCASVMKL